MNDWGLPLAVTVIITLATAILSIFALLRAGGAFKAASEFSEEASRETEAKVAALTAKFEQLDSQIAIRVCQPSPTAVRPGMNLNKRSQALQLYRRGEPPEAIAAALSIPKQEVDLLIKIHGIVLAAV